MSADMTENLKLGITGGIACGKSELGRILAEEGFRVLDADQVARDLLQRGNEEYDQTVELFGEEIVRADGELDRARLAEIVFADCGKLARLNSIVHPRTLQLCREWVAQCRDSRRAVIIPLLFEAGADDGWDAVVCIASSSANVLERLRARGLNEEQAELRIAAQMPIEEKMRRSDYVIVNDGDLDALRASALGMIEWVESKERK
jgi:dephospho-CoA kinase